MIKLKDILKEEMSSSDKRDMKSSTRNIDFHVGYIEKEIKKLVKILNKEGLRKSSRELELSFKNRILEFQKDVKNISAQHLQERTTGFTDSGRGYQSKEAQTFSVNAVKDASKKVGKLQQNVVGQFIKDIKQNKYDAMDLIRSIKTTSLGDASFSKKEFFLGLFDLIKKRTR
jgi:hypothetical protein